MRILLAWGIAVIAAAAMDGGEIHYRLTAAAEAVDRAGEIVTFAMPKNLSAPLVLHRADGGSVPVQTEAGGTGRFVIAEQKAGQTLSFVLAGANGAAAAPVTVAAKRAPTDVQIMVHDRPLLSYRVSVDAPYRAGLETKYRRAGYIHPILTPRGEMVTEDSPTNHPHHHGLWFAWSVTEFKGRKPNFWELGDQKGTVEFTGLDRVWCGPVDGGFVSHQRMMDQTVSPPVPVINQRWEVAAYDLHESAVPVLMFDLTSTDQCASADPLVLPKYRYGGLGFRGATGWNGKTSLNVLTSEGLTDRNKANAKPARWCYLGRGDPDTGAAAAGATVPGIVILGSPENFRAPQPLRLHPDMPFLSFAPNQQEGMSIEPGHPLVEKYRFITLDAPPDRALFEQYWQGYAHPAQITLEALP